MKSHWLALAIVVTTVTLVGCLPEKRVIWSPDGKWGLVRSDDGLYVCDADGSYRERTG